AGGPLLSIFGGKITTYRRLAEAALARLAPHIGVALRSWTDSAPLPGGDLPEQDFPAFLRECHSRWPFVPDDWLLRMARAYGTRLERIMRDARQLSDLGTQYGAGLSEAEVEYLEQNEWAISSDDILWRRTKLGLRMSVAERTHFERRDASVAGRTSVHGR
ncbi:MAG: glycerol-3-phosphate dehydrogenase C-terminal domain-containing protein, partial [Pseudomonadota bacterium]